MREKNDNRDETQNLGTLLGRACNQRVKDEWRAQPVIQKLNVC